MLDVSNVITLIVFGGVQLVSLIGTIWTVRTDAKILGVRVDAIAEEMKKISNILINQAEQSGRINLIEERQLAQGKRLDDVSSRVSRHIDKCNDK